MGLVPRTNAGATLLGRSFSLVATWQGARIPKLKTYGGTNVVYFGIDRPEGHAASAR